MRKTAVVYLAISSLFLSRADASSAPRATHSVDRSVTSLEGTPRGKSAGPTSVSGVLAYPATNPSAPTVVYLHGIHGRAENGCPWMRSGDGWLVCPEPAVKDGPGWSWTGNAKADASIVHAAIAATRSDATVVAVGFSQGAYVALDLVRTNEARFHGLVLMGADVNPDAKTLRSAGIARVVLSASKDEPWHGAVERNAERLSRDGAREGIAVRFVSLGHVRHTYVAEDPAVVREAIAWASAP